MTRRQAIGAQATGSTPSAPKGSRTTREGAAGRAIVDENRDPLSPSSPPFPPTGPISAEVSAQGPHPAALAVARSLGRLHARQDHADTPALCLSGEGGVYGECLRCGAPHRDTCAFGSHPGDVTVYVDRALWEAPARPRRTR